MDKQFTAGFPREKTPHDYEHIEALCGPDAYSTGHMDGWNGCRRAMLEAQEKAVPVAYAAGLEANMRGFLDVMAWSEGEFTIPLYTHPATSDAERLAEALRNARDYVQECFDKEKAEMAGYLHASELPTIGETLREIDEALAAHSAQAQPPAASVTDAMVKAAMRADFCGHNVADALMCGTDWNTEVMRAALEAALAAQENPNG